MIVMGTGHWIERLALPSTAKRKLSVVNGSSSNGSVVPVRSTEHGYGYVASALRKDLEALPSTFWSTANRNRTVIWRTYSPNHWGQGNVYTNGSCGSNLSAADALRINQNQLSRTGTNGDTPADTLNNAALTAWRGTSLPSFHVLNITHMSRFRYDAHPAGHHKGKPSMDCSHWCMPGVTDQWNWMMMLQLQLLVL